MIHEITLKSGLETFTINFKDRKKSVEIAFNPSDPDLPKRLFEAQKIIEKKSKELKKLELDENGMPNTDSCIEYFNMADKIVHDAIDYAFGNKISDAVFKYCGPYAIIDGEYYIWTFFESISPLLEKIVGESQKKASENMNKHLAKYMKK